MSDATQVSADGVAVTVDRFIGGRVEALQPSDGRHRAGLDAVMLAASLGANASGQVIDLGSGVGVAGFCVAARLRSTQVLLVDNDPVAVVLARNALNLPANASFASRVTVIEADVTATETERARAGLARKTADHVIMNPPFRDPGSNRVSPNFPRASAHVLSDAELDKWLRTAASILVDGGGLTVMWPATRLPALFTAAANRFGDLAVFPLFPRVGAAAIRVIVTAVKGSKAPLKLLAGLVLHDADGGPTAEARAILREGEGLRNSES